MVCCKFEISGLVSLLHLQTCKEYKCNVRPSYKTAFQVTHTLFQTHENLTELILSHNQLTELTGFNKIVMLKKLNLYSNSITSVDNIACLTDLPRLHDIDIAGMFLELFMS